MQSVLRLQTNRHGTTASQRMCSAMTDAWLEDRNWCQVQSSTMIVKKCHFCTLNMCVGYDIQCSWLPVHKITNLDAWALPYLLTWCLHHCMANKIFFAPVIVPPSKIAAGTVICLCQYQWWHRQVAILIHLVTLGSASIRKWSAFAVIDCVEPVLINHVAISTEGGSTVAMKWNMMWYNSHLSAWAFLKCLLKGKYFKDITDLFNTSCNTWFQCLSAFSWSNLNHCLNF